MCANKWLMLNRIVGKNLFDHLIVSKGASNVE